MNDYKAVLAEASSGAKPDSKIGHLYQENRLLPRPIWFRESRDIELRKDIAS